MAQTRMKTASTPPYMYNDQPFPAVVENDLDLKDMQEVVTWLKTNRDDLESRLSKSGTVLFRGFPVNSPEDFDRFIQALDYPNFAYEESLSNALRTNITERVFTANEAPPDVDIFLHHELAQTPLYPSRLLFYCDIAPDKGGATPLCRSDVLLERMWQELPDLTRKFADKGLRYTNVFAADSDVSSGQGRSWKSLLNAQTNEEAETTLKKLGYDWEWLADDTLKITSPVLPAIKKTEDGRDVFFNQLIAAFRGWKDTRNDPSKAVTFGDGTPISKDDMQKVIDLSDELIYDLDWQKGDVALVDNFLAMHGRKAFEGKRKVLASLVA